MPPFLRAFFAGGLPDRATAGSAIGLIYVAAFFGHLLLAALLAALLAWWLPGRQQQPNDLMATVLVAFAALQLPVGAAMAWVASGQPGKGPAVAGATVAAVMLSSPAWFIALMVVSNQRLVFLLVGAAVLMVAYGMGFAFMPRFVRAAITPPPEEEPATDPPAGPVSRRLRARPPSQRPSRGARS